LNAARVGLPLFKNFLQTTKSGFKVASAFNNDNNNNSLVQPLGPYRRHVAQHKSTKYG